MIKKKGVEMGTVVCCAVLKKKIYNPFHSLAYIYQTKTHKRFKHTTRHRRRARADGVLNARLLYTKYSRSLKLNMCTQYHPPRPGLARLMKIHVCV